MEQLKTTTVESGLKQYTIEPEVKETTSGLYVSAGEISVDYDKVDWKELLEDYTNMRNGGAVESTTVSILKHPILKAGYAIEHKDPLIVEYIEWCFSKLIDTFGCDNGIDEFLEHLFLALEMGTSFFEKVYKGGVYTPDGKITNIIQRLAPFKPETIWEFHYNEDMIFSGIRHERRENNTLRFVDIPAEKLFFYAHNAEYGDPRGRSEFRPIRNFYKIKKDIILATARAQQRGAGIPEVHSTKTGLSDAEKNNLNSIGRSIGNMKSGYIITDANTEIKLHSLQIQGSPEATLEYLNREMFFNTLTEFMASGIGSNGSRAATIEHKGSYELKVSAITQSVEKRLDTLLREMIDISCYSCIAEYPRFKFNRLDSLDVIAASNAIAKLYETTLLVKQEGDEDFIRGLFRLPEKKLINGVEVVNQIKPPEQVTNVTNNNGYSVKDFSALSFNRKLSAEEHTDFLRKNFDVQGTEKLYLKMQKDAESVIDEVMLKYITYIAKQKEEGKPVELKYEAELANRLNAIFRTGYKAGAEAVEKEIREADPLKFDGESVPPKVMKGISQSLVRYAGRLLFNIKTVVEDQIESDFDGKGSVIDYVMLQNFTDGFKTDRRTLIQKTSDGYLAGRSDVLEENKDKIELYLYNSILDTNLCDNCAVLTGAVLTLEEAEKLSLKIGKGRVNPNCLGSISQCRCNLMVYKLKGDFAV